MRRVRTTLPRAPRCGAFGLELTSHCDGDIRHPGQHNGPPGRGNRRSRTIHRPNRLGWPGSNHLRRRGHRVSVAADCTRHSDAVTRLIPPISVESNTFRYTLDALIARSDDLHRVAATVAHAATTAGVSARLDFVPGKLVLQVELERVARDISAVQADLDGVIATIEPSEVARSALATVSLWSALRPVSDWVVNRAPWQSGPAPWVPVTMTRQRDTGGAPRDFAERFARIPTGSERVRVDRFDTPTGPRFEVYLAGTDFAAGPDNPWWFGSNTELLASGVSRSTSATESALRHAGVTGLTPIVLTGHSQGGAIALALANSGRYAVDAVFTAGTPAGLVEAPTNVPIVHVVHPEDPVPALGGTIRGAAGTTWIVHPETRETGIEAHLSRNYQDSLVRIDDLKDPELTKLEDRIRIDGRGTAMWFRGAPSE